MLEDVDLFAGFFVACEREDGLPRLRLWKFRDRELQRQIPPAKSPFPSPPTARRPASTASGRQPTFATATSPSSRPVPYMNTISRHGESRFSSSRKFPAASTAPSTRASASRRTAADRRLTVPISTCLRARMQARSPGERSRSTFMDTALTVTRSSGLQLQPAEFA